MGEVEVEHGLEEGNVGMWRLVDDWLVLFVDWLGPLQSLLSWVQTLI